MLSSTPQTQSPAPPSDQRVVKILALDDNPVDTEMLSRCLRGMQPWEVKVIGCLTVEAALEAIQHHDFELLFLDYMLPSYSGFEALTELRAHGYDAPTILMTGMQNDGILVEAMQAGIVDFLPKAALSKSSVQRAARNAVEKADLAREVSVKSTELRKTVARLERRQEEIESFYHNVSHELKTPLTGSREYVSLVIDGAAGAISDDQTKLLQAALRGCDQMVTCINDMLDASRLDVGTVALVPDSVDLAGLVRRVAKEAEPAARSRQVAIVQHLPDAEVMVVVDSQRISQAITNLVANAVKFSDPAGRVEITLDSTSWEELRISITDDGCGIRPEDRSRIFDRLYQSNAQDAATQGGLGMGLYIAREVVELHSGHLSFVSEPGQGSTFTISLPRRTQAPSTHAHHV